MRMMPTLILTATGSCVVCCGNGAAKLERNESLLIPCGADAEVFFTVWGRETPADSGRKAIPQMHSVRFENGKAVYSDADAIDWGDAAEVFAVPCCIIGQERERPRFLDSAEFYYRDRRSGAELYRDGGIKLVFTPTGADPLELSLGRGESGSLRVLDVGSDRLLAALIDSDKGKRLVLIDRSGGILLDEEGSAASISDGYPTVIRSLGTVRGHSVKTRYEYSGGTVKEADSATGFFLKEEMIPQSDAETALALAEEIRLGLFRPDDYRFAGSLDGEVSGEELRSFFGEYDAERLCPLVIEPGKVVLGLYKKAPGIVTARKFAFAFSEGAIADVEEL